MRYYDNGVINDPQISLNLIGATAQKMKFSIKDFFSK